jgi:hypothetical protein
VAKKHQEGEARRPGNCMENTYLQGKSGRNA